MYFLSLVLDAVFSGILEIGLIKPIILEEALDSTSPEILCSPLLLYPVIFAWRTGRGCVRKKQGHPRESSRTVLPFHLESAEVVLSTNQSLGENIRSDGSGAWHPYRSDSLLTSSLRTTPCAEGTELD